jgi:hypothetical protein
MPIQAVAVLHLSNVTIGNLLPRKTATDGGSNICRSQRPTGTAEIS